MFLLGAAGTPLSQGDFAKAMDMANIFWAETVAGILKREALLKAEAKCHQMEYSARDKDWVCLRCGWTLAMVKLTGKECHATRI